MRPFLVCIHDATPAYARLTERMVRELAPLVGRRLSFGVVPDWCGAWPLSAHRDYCNLVSDSASELLLHGYYHQRRRGRGAITLLAGSDEMNGLDVDETRRTITAGQHVFSDVFGEPARGFIAPAWQRGRVRFDNGATASLEHVVGFFSVESRAGERIPLATWTWDCGRWGWLGYMGERTGSLLRTVTRAVPALAIHPRDVERGFWPNILRLTGKLLDAGCEPATPSSLLEALRVEVHV